VRARIVEDPKDYTWSSCGAYAYGETDSVIERHSIHDALAEEEGDKRKKYREVVRGMMREKKAMKEEMDRRVVYGNEAFIRKVQMAYKVEALIKPKGRPRKSANENN
jgi:hypothetical protein